MAVSAKRGNAVTGNKYTLVETPFSESELDLI
jgi:hypothetical protein